MKRLMKSCSGGSRLVDKSYCWNSSTNAGDTGVAMASLDTCLLRAASVMNIYMCL